MQIKLCTAISAIDYTGKWIRLVTFLRSVFLGSESLNDIEIVLLSPKKCWSDLYILQMRQKVLGADDLCYKKYLIDNAGSKHLCRCDMKYLATGVSAFVARHSIW